MWHNTRVNYVVRVGPKGRVVVPAALRRELGMEEGAELVARSQAGTLVLEPRSLVLERLRGRVRNAVLDDVDLADEIVAERRREVRTGR